MTNPAQPRGTPSKRRGASLTDFEQLLNLNSTKAPSTADIPDTAEAVIYLRVSTTRQMNTAIDIDEDGNSIATQREATIRRCRQLKAPISKEFVEPGNSAQSIAKRPQFKQLLHYVEEHTEVGYVVIYMRSRAFRNLTDAAITKRILASMGVKLVSAKEEFGEGYMADAMEAITDIMNEVQVRQSGEDVANKMYHKAKNGGTTGRAKLGYLNVRKDIEGRLVNTIAVDPQRAPLIQWAFEQYATGEYSLVRLLQELTDQGLTTRRTAKYPEQPVSRSKLASMFRDPYYIGMVTFKGETFTGRHEALISPELFQRVQDVMDACDVPNATSSTTISCEASSYVDAVTPTDECTSSSTLKTPTVTGQPTNTTCAEADKNESATCHIFKPLISKKLSGEKSRPYNYLTIKQYNSAKKSTTDSTVN